MNAANSINSPIMIGGCGSSGSTLLSQLLAEHPSIYCGEELYILNKKDIYNQNIFLQKRSQIIALAKKDLDASALRKTQKTDILISGLNQNIIEHSPQYQVVRMPEILTTGLLGYGILGSSTYANLRRSKEFIYRPDRHNLSSEDILNAAENSYTFKDFIDNIFRVLLHRVNKTRWAEKTPTNCYCIREFLELYPTGKYVHVIRDGRDVVSSLIKRGLNPDIATRRWMHDTAMSIPYRHSDRYHELRYENLVEDPVKTLQKLMVFLGESQNVSFLIEARANPKSMAGFGSWSLQADEPISNKATQKWITNKYPQKSYVQQLFRFTKLFSKFIKELGLSNTMNANDLLNMYGYDLGNAWNSAPKTSIRVKIDYQRERFFKFFRQEDLYSDFLLS